MFFEDSELEREFFGRGALEGFIFPLELEGLLDQAPVFTLQENRRLAENLGAAFAFEIEHLFLESNSRGTVKKKLRRGVSFLEHERRGREAYPAHPLRAFEQQ